MVTRKNGDAGAVEQLETEAERMVTRKEDKYRGVEDDCELDIICSKESQWL